MVDSGSTERGTGGMIVCLSKDCQFLLLPYMVDVVGTISWLGVL